MLRVIQSLIIISNSCEKDIFERICLMHMKMSYSHDFEPFEKRYISNNVLFAWFRKFKNIEEARSMSYTYDIETLKNRSHKQSVLFYEPCRNINSIWFRATTLMVERPPWTAHRGRPWTACGFLIALNTFLLS